MTLHARRGWEIRDIRGPQPGDLTRSYETAGLQAIRKRGGRVGRRFGDNNFDGFTEAWPTTSLRLESISELIEWINDDESTELG